MKTVSIEKLFVPPLLDQQSTPFKKLRAPIFSDLAKFCVDGLEILGRTRKTFFTDRQQSEHEHTRTQRLQFFQQRSEMRDQHIRIHQRLAFTLAERSGERRVGRE